MLKVLLKKQLQEIAARLMRGSKKGEKKKSGKRSAGIGMILVLLLAVAYLIFIFVSMANGMAEPLFEVDLKWLYYLGCGGIAILLGTVGSVFNTYSTLYLAKDNDLLLSMPIPIRSLILSRLLGVYVTGLGYSGIVTLPAVAVGWYRGGVTLQTVLGGIVFVLMISLLVLALSCLLGWGVARLSQRLKNKSYITVFLSLLFLGLYYYVYFKVVGKVDDLLENVIAIGGRIRNDLYPIYLFGKVGEGDWLAMGVWTAAILLILAGVCFLLKNSFLSVVTSTPEGKRAVYREQPARQGSISAALLRKEWGRFVSSSTYMLNCGMGLVFLVAFGVTLLVKGEILTELLRETELPAGELEQTIGVLLTGACCVVQSMVYITAPSVSLEGKTVWQLQCLPVSAWQILQAKLRLQLAVTAIPTLFSLICILIFVPMAVAQMLLTAAVVLLFALMIALLGLVLGLLMPNLNWTNEIRPVKQGAAVLCAIFLGLALGSAVIACYFWFGAELGASAYLGLTALLLAVLSGAMTLYLRGPGARRFEAL
ncbi:MAG: hypothetical protein IIY70_03405 [Oscillospiraceae bacterium]|nr:hypothetical protein [Oscillospiraceae bacterium]